MTYPFDDFVRTTMGATTNVADGSKLTPAQIQQVADYLRSPGSGLTASSSVADYVTQHMALHKPKLSPSMDYIAYAGKGNSGISNFKNSEAYMKAHECAGLIGNTPWGKFIQDPANAADKQVMADKLEHFMAGHGIKPINNDYKAAIEDVMWNAGSEPYMTNAIESGRPIRAFVENATPNRGFTNFELPTALKSPDTIINGYPIRAYTGDPVAFASRSATEIQQVEDHLAQSAGANSGRAVSVADIRADVNVTRGYDAVHKTMFGQPLDQFSRLDLDQMSAANRAWSAEQAKATVRPSSEPEVESARASAAEQHPSFGSPRDVATIPMEARVPESLATSEGTAIRSGLSPEIVRGASALGAAAVAYDATTTFAHGMELMHEGNVTATLSQMEHLGGRTAGGLGGAAVGAEIGSFGGPVVAAIGGVVGGGVGAFGGEKLVEAHDNARVYHQTDPQGQTWNFDPKQPQQGWTRDLPPLPETPHGQHFQAEPALANRLNYQANSTATELAMGRVSTPANPYSQPANAQDAESFGNPPWTRNTESGQWTRPINAPFVERRATPEPQTETALPQRAAQLDVAAQQTISDNLTYSMHGIAEQYQSAYEQHGWSQYGPMPESVTNALKTPENTLQASDGHTYTRSQNGQWNTLGTLWGTNAAEGLVLAELEATRQLQRALHGEGSQPDRAQEAHRQQEMQGHAPAREAPLPSAQAATAPPIPRTHAREVPPPRHEHGLTDRMQETQTHAAPRHEPTTPPDHTAIAAAQQAHHQAVHAQRQAQEERVEARAVVPPHAAHVAEIAGVDLAVASVARDTGRTATSEARSTETPAQSPRTETPPPALTPPLDPPALRDFRHPDHPLHARYQMFRDALGEQGFHQDRPTLNAVPDVRHYSPEQKDRLAASFTAYLGARQDYHDEIQHFLRNGDTLQAVEHPQRLGTPPLVQPTPEKASLARTPEQHAAAWRARELPEQHPVNTQRPDPQSLSPDHFANPANPHHALFEHARHALTSEYARWGMQKDAGQIDRETVQVMIAARHGQLLDVGAVRFTKMPEASGLGEHPNMAVYESPKGPQQGLSAMVCFVKGQTLQQAPPLQQAAQQFHVVDQQATQQTVANQQWLAQVNAQAQQGQALGR